MKLTEILENLRQPLPPQSLAAKTIKGQQITYTPWYALADLLDERAGLGGWEWQVKDTSQIGDRLTLTGCLTVHGTDRALTMCATGSESVNCSGYGDPSSNAEAMALRRAAAKFGLGRELWVKDKPAPQRARQPRTNQQVPAARLESASPIQALPSGEISREEWLRRKAAAQR